MESNHIPGTWGYSGTWYGNHRVPDVGPASLWYVARCPDCDGHMWCKNCELGYVRCSLCDTQYTEEFIREVNEDPDFHLNQEGGDSERE